MHSYRGNGLYLYFYIVYTRSIFSHAAKFLYMSLISSWEKPSFVVRYPSALLPHVERRALKEGRHGLCPNAAQL